MNLAQSLAAAAAAAMVAMSASGVAPADTIRQVVAEARAQLAPATIRRAVEDLDLSRCASARNVERWIRAGTPSFACAARR